MWPSKAASNTSGCSPPRSNAASASPPLCIASANVAARGDRLDRPALEGGALRRLRNRQLQNGVGELRPPETGPGIFRVALIVGNAMLAGNQRVTTESPIIFQGRVPPVAL